MAPWLFIWMLASVLCCFSTTGFCADVQTKTVTATGSGNSRKDAIQDALIEAVSKANGIAMDVETANRLASVTKSTDTASSSSEQQNFNSRIGEISKGAITGWDIIRETEGVPYTVKLSVTVAKITDAGEHATRKTMAVMSFHANADGNIDGQSVSQETLSEGFRQSLLTYLTSSRKFAIVDETFKKEEDQIDSGKGQLNDTLQSALAKANQLGADFLAVGICDGFQIGIKTMAVGTMTANIRTCSGLIRLRVIQVDTRQTVLAADFPLNCFHNINLNGKDPQGVVFDSAGKMMANRILDTIYPIRISGIGNGNTVILDRGGEAIQPGDVYDVFQIGDRMTDHSTGESLGYQEMLVGRVQIQRVLPKVSYASVLEHKSDILADNICRKANAESQPKITKAPSLSSPVDALFK